MSIPLLLSLWPPGEPALCLRLQMPWLHASDLFLSLSRGAADGLGAKMASQVLTHYMLNLFLRKHQNMFVFSGTSWNWDMVLVVEIFPRGRQKTWVFFRANTIAVDDLVKQGARAPTAVVLAYFFQNIGICPHHQCGSWCPVDCPHNSHSQRECDTLGQYYACMR